MVGGSATHELPDRWLERAGKRPPAEEQAEHGREESKDLPHGTDDEDGRAGSHSDQGQALPPWTREPIDARDWGRWEILDYLPHVTTSPMAAANIAMVVPQPRTFSQRPL